ncbi:MAG TPA: HEAT repeat domain-containing protein [Dehalococcoidia bacterium]|nr:HEAT repeat domain-containing protein [Dehalococcoidia bacterium]
MTSDEADAPLDIGTLADPDQRPTAIQLTRLSSLDSDDLGALAEAWPDMVLSRRLSIVMELTDLAQDNIDLNFDAVHKTALRDEDPQVRSAALRGLFEYEGRDLLPDLATFLREDPDIEVRREAAIALGRYALEAELGHLRDSDCRMIREVLMESAEDIEEDERVRARAIEALGAISGEETENLIESIYDEDSMWLKVGAIDAMGRSCNDVWLPTVLREMENRAPEMRHAAAFAAGQIAEEEAIDPLKRAAILDPDREVQLAAIHSLGEIGGPRAKVALQSVLYEGDDNLADAVQEALAEIAFSENPLQPDI